jgi:hypothetical protein
MFKLDYQQLFKDPMQQLSFKFLNSLENPVTFKKKETGNNTREMPMISRALCPLKESGDRWANARGNRRGSVKLGLVDINCERPKITVTSVKLIRSPLVKASLPHMPRHIYMQRSSKTICAVIS